MVQHSLAHGSPEQRTRLGEAGVKLPFETFNDAVTDSRDCWVPLRSC